MRDMVDFEATLQSLLQLVEQRLPTVFGVWLFGSRARGDARPDSDIDLAVLGPNALDPVAVFDLGLDLGVLARRDVDLVDLRKAPLVLRKEVFTQGRLVACGDADRCEEFVAESMALYVAFRDELAIASRGAEGHR